MDAVPWVVWSLALLESRGRGCSRLGSIELWPVWTEISSKRTLRSEAARRKLAR
jgi:hypothetical protein